MEITLVIIFILTLVYVVTAGRMSTYINIIAIQGVLLFLLAIIKLKEIHISNLIFILAETLIFKSILVPYYLRHLAKKNKVTYETDPDKTNFNAILKVSAIIIMSFLMANKLHFHAIDIIMFTASISAIFCGALIVIRRKKVLTHVKGYLVLENGIFLISLSIGSEMPIAVNLCILFDIITTVLFLGVFVNEMSKVYKGLEITQLNNLKD
jgi:hydrogenase-4 component E